MRGVDGAAYLLAAATATLAAQRVFVGPLLIGLVAWLAVISASGAHSSAALRMRRASVAMFIAAVGLMAAGMVLAILLGLPLRFVFIWGGVLLGAGLVGRSLVFRTFEHSPIGLALAVDQSTAGFLWPRLTGLLGAGYEIRAAIDSSQPRFVERVKSVLAVRAIDQLVVNINRPGATDDEETTRAARARGITVLTLEEFYEDLTGHCIEDRLDVVEPLPRSIWHPLGSRIVDIVAGLAYLPVCAVVIPLSAMASGPTLTSWETIGRNHRAFRLTTLPTAGAESGLLRRILSWVPVRLAPTCLNLLTGTLSVIGPEPVAISGQPRSDKPWRLRERVRPGITGWAQINGCAAGDRSLPYDAYYVRHQSLGFDLAILLRTLASPLLSWRAADTGKPNLRRQSEVVIPGPIVVDPSDELVSVVVPAFQESGRVEQSLHLLVTEMEALAAPFEIIVVSDGSTDGTELEAARTAGPITVVHYGQNRGKGYALRRGLADSRGGRVVFIDADMDLHPNRIGPLLALLDAGADVAIGSKRHPESRVHYPWPRRLQSAVYQWLVRRLFGLKVTDTQTGLKTFRGPLVREVAAPLTTEGFAFDLELLVELNARGAVIVEGPVQLDYAFQSTTGVRAVRDTLWETLRLWHQRRAAQSTAETVWT